jgi:hypothetical protein
VSVPDVVTDVPEAQNVPSGLWILTLFEENAEFCTI